MSHLPTLTNGHQRGKVYAASRTSATIGISYISADAVGDEFFISHDAAISPYSCTPCTSFSVSKT